MSLQVGQKVVCVDDDNWLNSDKPGPHPVKGHVYTVAEQKTFKRIAAVSLDEFYPGHFFMARRFRPVKATSIDVFLQMLVTPPKEPVSA